MLFGTCSSAAAGIRGGGQGALLCAQPWHQGGPSGGAGGVPAWSHRSTPPPQQLKAPTGQGGCAGRRLRCSTPSPAHAQPHGAAAPASLGTCIPSLRPGCLSHLWQRSCAGGQRVASALHSCHDTERTPGHPCAATVHPRRVRVHPRCLPTHGVPAVCRRCRHLPPQGGTSRATSSRPAPAEPYETLHESKSGLNQIIPNNNDINYAFNTFYCFPPLPFTPHLCEQYPKDLRFSPVITDTQPAHLSKYLLSNQAPLQSLPEICVDSSHSRQKMSNQDLCGACKVFHKEFACRETRGHVTDGDKMTEGEARGPGDGGRAEGSRGQLEAAGVQERWRCWDHRGKRRGVHVWVCTGAHGCAGHEVGERGEGRLPGSGKRADIWFL